MRVDPRTRLIIVVCFSTISVLAKDIAYLTIVFSVLLLLDIIMGVKVVDFIIKAKFLISIILFITIIQSLTVKGGKTIVYLGNINILTLDGIIKGGEFALRMLIIILASANVSVAKGREMIDGLIKMKLPYEIAFMTSIALRFIPVFRDEFKNRINAISMRGIDIKKLGLKKKIKVYSYMVFPTVSGTVLKSKELALAMEARAFRAYNKRTMLRDIKIIFRDYVIITSVIIFTIAFLSFMYIKGGII